jgi:phosphatidylserine/phosphatidylglycerophosphate/cardiolipin synthase-like enzyme
MDLLRGVRNVEIRVKPPSRRTLMHLKVNIVDGALLREGSANWSPAGLKEQDNSLIFRSDREAIVNFKHDFEAPWNRPGNISVQ